MPIVRHDESSEPSARHNALPCYLTRPAFLAGLAFFAGVRLPFTCATPGSGVVIFSVSIVFAFIVFLLDWVAVVTIHHSGQKEQQVNY
jgi:hypothetical protein